MNSPSTTKRMTWSIVAVLVAWGIYLAIGATGMFVQPGNFDVRKSLIVLVCFALFFGLWSIVFYARKAQDAIEPRTRWSRAGVTSCAFCVGGIVLWTSAVITWQSVSTSATTVQGWLAALSFIGASTFGMIALSDRFVRRGKWLGAMGLGVSLMSLIFFLIRMTP